MCTRPLQILNPKITHQSTIQPFNPRYDKEFITVSCGHCPDCVSRKQKEWQTRAWYEYKNCISLGGKVPFLTLTYNDEHLPLYKGIPVFCKRDLQLFFKNLRKQLKLFTGHDVTFRYLVTSEYGSERNRPHYHLLLFVYDNINDADLFRLAWCCWSESPSECLDIFKHSGTDISKYSKLRGIVQIGKNKQGQKSLLVSNIAGINYVTKYICKDIRFDYHKDRLFHSYVVKMYPEFANLDFHLDAKDTLNHPLLSILRVDFLKEFKPFDLFHLQSHGFGSSIISLLNDTQKLTGFGSSPRLEDGSARPVQLPFYIQRKLYYDTQRCVVGLKLKLQKKGKNYVLKLQKDWSTRYVLNDFGFKHRLCILDDMVERKVQHVAQLRCLFPTGEFMKTYFPEFDKVSDVWKEFDLLMSFRPLKHLFEYQYIFKDRNIVDFGTKALYNKTPKFYQIMFESPTFKHIQKPVERSKYNTLYPFINFDKCLSILEKFDKYLAYEKECDFVRIYNERQNCDAFLQKYRVPRLKSIPKLYNF